MSKPMKTAAELVALLNAELRKQDACTGVSVDGLHRLQTKGSPAPGQLPPSAVRVGPVPGQCSRFFVAASSLLQPRYDLASEELT